ncbi:MAG: (d)CMP kinase [Defluviitaleaceae bacterium]|nr:(d)CMP kinase [Defluviitaleaceae bacterium]
MGIQIAIDGPSGSGKSTIAKALAARLGFVHIDTGAMYRTVALAARRTGVNWDDEAAILALMEKISIDIDCTDSGQRIFLDGCDVTTDIRTAEMGMGASRVSVFAGVRDRLVALQQGLAAGRNVVMDGRDIGTVVLVDATVKIFLTADVKVRAKRRCTELTQLGRQSDFDDIAAQITRRDHDDSNRAISPLKIAHGATVVDTSSLDVDGVVAEIMKIIAEREVV